MLLFLLGLFFLLQCFVSINNSSKLLANDVCFVVFIQELGLAALFL